MKPTIKYNQKSDNKGFIKLFVIASTNHYSFQLLRFMWYYNILFSLCFCCKLFLSFSWSFWATERPL